MAAYVKLVLASLRGALIGAVAGAALLAGVFSLAWLLADVGCPLTDIALAGAVIGGVFVGPMVGAGWCVARVADRLAELESGGVAERLARALGWATLTAGAFGGLGGAALVWVEYAVGIFKHDPEVVAFGGFIVGLTAGALCAITAVLLRLFPRPRAPEPT